MEYREAKIPKKGGKFRKIVVPDKELLRYQRSKLKGLQNVYMRLARASGIENIVHGFLRGRNAVTAATAHIGYTTTIMMDISAFFDSVYKSALPETMQDPLLYHKNGYCAQGFATSPILANIASINMVKSIKVYLDKEYPGSAFTVYADDLQISVNTTDRAVLNRIIGTVSEFINGNDFEVNTSKTRIKFAKYGWRRILGVNVGEYEVRATRKTMRKIRAAKHQSNGPSLGGLQNWANCNLPNAVK